MRLLYIVFLLPVAVWGGCDTPPYSSCSKNAKPESPCMGLKQMVNDPSLVNAEDTDDTFFRFSVHDGCLDFLGYTRDEVDAISVRNQVYLYKVLVGTKVTTWKEAKVACEYNNARLPIFRHGSDNNPGADLLFFYNLVKAAGVSAIQNPRGNGQWDYQYRRGGHWKSCFPIGLIKTVDNIETEGPAAWRWLTGEPVKNPADASYGNTFARLVRDKYWKTTKEHKKGDPIADIEEGAMKFGYLMAGSDEIYYFNDFNDLSKSKRQQSSCINATGKVLKEVCPPDDPKCVPCTPGYILCQKPIRSGYKEDPEIAIPDDD